MQVLETTDQTNQEQVSTAQPADTPMSEEKKNVISDVLKVVSEASEQISEEETQSQKAKEPLGKVDDVDVGKHIEESGADSVASSSNDDRFSVDRKSVV